MNIVAVGVGGAGGRIVDELHRDTAKRPVSYLAESIVVDTDRESLVALDHVPTENRHTFGEFSLEGSGTNGYREAAREAAVEQVTELRRAIDDAITTDVTGIVLAAGLGGGVGAGATPALASALASVYDRPIYTVSVLPAGGDETEAENAARALAELDEIVDCQLTLDNDAWVGEEQALTDRIPALNREFADRLGTLCLAGDVRGAGQIGENVLDERDVIGTLDAGGLAAIGYASRPVSRFREFEDSLVGRLRDRVLGSASDDERYDGVTRTLQWAGRGRLTLDCELTAASSVLALFSGPPDWLHRKAIADGRSWLEKHTAGASLRSGDAPLRGGDSLAVLVVFAGIESAPRIEELQARM
jgi:cell division GTPase FtsZ